MWKLCVLVMALATAAAAETKPSLLEPKESDSARSATLLEPDTNGAMRGIAEVSSGILTAFLPTFFLSFARGVGIGGLIFTSVISAAASSAIVGLVHVLMEGKGGFGFAMLGGAIGGVAAFLLGVIGAVTGLGAITLFAAILSVGLPPLGAAIAIEMRDSVIRRGGVSQRETPVFDGLALAF